MPATLGDSGRSIGGSRLFQFDQKRQGERSARDCAILCAAGPGRSADNIGIVDTDRTWW
jgi:hypothetical protein